MNITAVREAAASIRAVTTFVPDIGIVLGSGLGALAENLAVDTAMPYHAIRHFMVPSVEGHPGRLVLGTAGGARVAVLQGRVHLYEGCTPDEVCRAVRTLGLLGVRTLVLTNAAGGINPSFEPGNLMIIRDQLNLQCASPLTGPNDDALGPRFPDMSEVYSGRLQMHLDACGSAEKITMQSGIYAGVPGPAYETPAEIGMLKTLGADAVGMSTVCEAIAARHMGMHVCGISLITNKAAGTGSGILTHADVRAAAGRAGDAMVRLLLRALSDMPLAPSARPDLT